MDATLHDIVSHREHLAFSSPADFVLGPGQPVSSRLVVEQPGWSLYTLEKDTQSAWFVELPPDLDLSQAPFAYLDQHRHARRVLRVPFEALENLADALPPLPQVIVIFSIGRCGSTLLSNVLNTVPGVWSLSEPDAYSRLVMENYTSTERLGYPPEQVVRLIRACTRLLFRPPPSVEARVFAVKFRSQATFQADLYHRALPEASFVFLYREALSWANSFSTMLRKYQVPGVLTGEERSWVWNVVTAAEDLSKARPYLDLEADEVPLEDALAPGWARNMEEYTKHLHRGVPFLALRYDDLNKTREASLERLFAHCGLPVDAVKPALAAFERDSQANTRLSRDAKGDALSQEQRSRLAAILAQVPVYGDPNLRLADIYSPGATSTPAGSSADQSPLGPAAASTIFGVPLSDEEALRGPEPKPHLDPDLTSRP